MIFLEPLSCIMNVVMFLGCKILLVSCFVKYFRLNDLLKFSQMLFPKALAFVVSCLLNVQPFVISCLRSLTDREVEMRVRSYTPSPSPPPRGHGRRGRSPSPTPRGGGPYRDLSATLFVRNLSHDCRYIDLITPLSHSLKHI